MIYLIHGDNHLLSRSRLTDLVKKSQDAKQEVVFLDGLTVGLGDFIQALTPTSLFSNQRMIVIENLFSRQKSKEQQQIFDFLKKFLGEPNLILWEKKQIGKVAQRNLPKNCQIQLFKLPVLLFKFLDQITPQNKLIALKSLRGLLKTQAAELIFFMVARQFRLLLILESGGKFKGPLWMAGKIKKQAEAFGLARILTKYRDLCTIEKLVKTGKSPMSLAWHLEIFLLNLAD